MMVTAQRNKSAPKYEDINKFFIRLIAPAVAVQIINIINNIADIIYVGHIENVGILALTGVGVCLPLKMLISAFSAFISSEASLQVSELIESNEKEKAEKVFGNIIALIIISSAVLTAFFLLFTKDILSVIGASPNTMHYAIDYIKIYSIGIVFVQLTIGLNAFVSSQGFLKTSIYTLLSGAALNIILNPIFIFKLGFGVKGAALATVISQMISMFLLLCFIHRNKMAISLRIRHLKPKTSSIRTYFSLASSIPFLIKMSESIVLICYSRTLLKYGGDLAVGALVVGAVVMQIAEMPLIGMGEGAKPLISYNYSEKNISVVLKTVKLLVIFSFAYSVMFWALVEIWPNYFVGILLGDPKFITKTAPLLRIYIAANVFYGIQIALHQLSIALGKEKIANSVAVLHYVLLLILINTIPDLNFSESKTNAIFITKPIATLTSALIMTMLFLVTLKKTVCAMSERKPNYGQQSRYYRLLKKAVLFFTRPMKTMWEVPFDGKPSVFVCNHDRAYGPISMCAHFDMSDDIRPWINAQMLSTRKAPKYIRNDYWWNENKWYSSVLDYTAAYLCALILPPILRGSDCVPVYHDTKVITTLRKSTKKLSEGKHLLLFPEHPTGYCQYGEKIYEGFISVGRLYYAKTKETVNFYPTYVDWKKKIIRVGRPITYDPHLKYEKQVKETTESIEEFFKRLNKK